MKEVVWEETAPWGGFVTPSHATTGSVILRRTDCFDSLVLAIYIFKIYDYIIILYSISITNIYI